jgi:hypothetical protein
MGLWFAAVASHALAADLPLKAPPPPEFGPGGSGWYLGLGTEASVQQVDVSKSNLFVTGLTSGNLTASGGSVTGTIGYINGNPLRWWRCEAQVGYQNITGSNAVIGSVASRWNAAQGCDIGFEWLARVTSLLPNLGLTLPVFTPALPANIAVAAGPKQYVGVRAVEQGVQGDFFGPGGSTWSWAPAVQTGWLFQPLDALGKPNGGGIDAYVRVAWFQRGLTVSSVGFNATGAPVFTTGDAKLNTEYTAGLKYDFPI